VANNKNVYLERRDWLQGALELLSSSGIEGVKIVPLAKRLGVTSGSFYWHFKNRKILLDALLEYWEHEITDIAIERAKDVTGSPMERIWGLMEQFMVSGISRYDLAIWQWTQSDPKLLKVYRRTIERYINLATSVFEEAGFNRSEARTRGRIMVVYTMGESTLASGRVETRKKQLKSQFDILTWPQENVG
jgi:AcrR family transcriptional regulator